MEQLVIRGRRDGDGRGDSNANRIVQSRGNKSGLTNAQLRLPRLLPLFNSWEALPSLTREDGLYLHFFSSTPDIENKPCLLVHW
jgi:hypothetical protein